VIAVRAAPSLTIGDASARDDQRQSTATAHIRHPGRTRYGRETSLQPRDGPRRRPQRLAHPIDVHPSRHGKSTMPAFPLMLSA